jgi:hypothetical protein
MPALHSSSSTLHRGRLLDPGCRHSGGSQSLLNRKTCCSHFNLRCSLANRVLIHCILLTLPVGRNLLRQVVPLDGCRGDPLTSDSFLSDWRAIPPAVVLDSPQVSQGTHIVSEPQGSVEDVHLTRSHGLSSTVSSVVNRDQGWHRCLVATLGITAGAKQARRRTLQLEHGQAAQVRSDGAETAGVEPQGAAWSARSGPSGCTKQRGATVCETHKTP